MQFYYIIMRQPLEDCRTRLILVCSALRCTGTEASLRLNKESSQFCIVQRIMDISLIVLLVRQSSLSGLNEGIFAGRFCLTINLLERRKIYIYTVSFSIDKKNMVRVLTVDLQCSIFVHSQEQHCLKRQLSQHMTLTG